MAVQRGRSERRGVILLYVVRCTSERRENKAGGLFQRSGSKDRRRAPGNGGLRYFFATRCWIASLPLNLHGHRCNTSLTPLRGQSYRGTVRRNFRISQNDG
jgi:hypothetical protein